MDKHVHIISLTIPYPPDYGGVFDLYYKLPALQRAGVKIHLHCFQYDREPASELNRYCEEVFYYNRLSPVKSFSPTIPYIVGSRRNSLLFERLDADNHPVLMEGIHTTALLLDNRFENRKKFLRIHNVEHHYYHNLFRHSKHPVNKLYYAIESRLLRQYEHSVAVQANGFFAVTEKDAAFYRDRLKAKNVHYVPIFLPPEEIAILPGFGTYCLYHGNLEVEENETVALHLIRSIFKRVDISLIIAGKNPSQRLYKAAASHPRIQIIPNVSNERMDELIRNAQINVLPSVTDTGIKIKLIHALSSGRHCIANAAMVSGSGVAQLCHIADSDEALIERIQQLYHQRFSENEIEMRKQVLHQIFNNEEAATKMISVIFSDI